jgi:hypothetical protein
LSGAKIILLIVAFSCIINGIYIVIWNFLYGQRNITLRKRIAKETGSKTNIPEMDQGHNLKRDWWTIHVMSRGI